MRLTWKQIIDKIYWENVGSYRLRAETILWYFRTLPHITKKEEQAMKINYEYQKIKANDELYRMMKNYAIPERVLIMSDLISLNSN